MKAINLRFILPILLISCQGRSSTFQVNENIDSASVGIINIRYEPKKQKAILLDGILNDSIPVNVFLETGWGVDYITVSDSLLPILGYNKDENSTSKVYTPGDSSCLKIGNIQETRKISFLQKNNFLFHYLGSNTAVINWEFFKDQIIEISIKERYAKILKNTDSLDEFTQIAIDRQSGLIIPITVYIQGKKITRNVLIDTGYNGCIDFNDGNEIIDEYMINMDNVQHAVSFGVNTQHSKYFVDSDSIKIGNLKMQGCKIGLKSRTSKTTTKIGLLGNEFLENFTVVLDLKEFKMYLKPI